MKNNQQDLPAFLPMTRTEMLARGWDELDILIVSADAYVDHPAFGTAMVGRWLESKGFRVGIIAQPDWRDSDSVEALGRPRLFAAISGGAVDSMLNLFTANKKRRSEDDYSPGGRNDRRPPRATIVYANLLSRVFPRLPLVIGGVEASLRRLVHYDYWDDCVRSSILLDSGADLLIYGMGERAILEAARRIESADKRGLKYIAGTVFAGEEADLPGAERTIFLPSREEIEREPAKLIEATLAAHDHVNPYSRNYIAQRDGERLVIEAEPARPLSERELDALYELPFTRRAHPSYKEKIPALEPVKFSITVHRGCYGGCTFCGLGLHQGKAIQSRSVASILREIRRLASMPDFKGIISDLGGPSANMYGTTCKMEHGRTGKPCARRSCLFPAPCKHLNASHARSLEMLDGVSSLPEVRRALIASGVRFDLALLDARYIEALAARHTGGHLSVAPEHCVEKILRLMGKPPIKVFEKFRERFERASRAAGKEQYVVPYLISSFPGSTEKDMAELRTYLKEQHLRSEQVQDFIPLPMTLACAMFYAGRGLDGKTIPVARGSAKLRQQSHIKPHKKFCERHLTRPCKRRK